MQRVEESLLKGSGSRDAYSNACRVLLIEQGSTTTSKQSSRCLRISTICFQLERTVSNEEGNFRVLAIEILFFSV